jgi:hypothetical protein
MYKHLEYIIGTYISFRQETVIMKVVMWPLLNLVFGLNYKMFKPTTQPTLATRSPGSNGSIHMYVKN